jgi:hypothetical protein
LVWLRGGITIHPHNQRIHHQYSLGPKDAYFQRERFTYGYNATARAVVLLGSSLTTPLAVRFTFALLDTNRANGIVSFVNSVAEPFVAPFYGLFNYAHISIGIISFQGYTIVAIFAYSLLTAGLTRLASVTRY